MTDLSKVKEIFHKENLQKYSPPEKIQLIKKERNAAEKKRG